MKQFLEGIFSAPGFMPHGHCYLWTPSLVWLQVVSDVLVGLSFFSIPLSLGWLMRKRVDLDFRWMLGCFAAFILACGATHLLEAWNVWHADYWLSGWVKAVTALVSLPTAILLTRLVPIALLTPSRAELGQVNEQLAAELAGRLEAEAKLRDLNGELERRVAERTAELKAANMDLQNDLEEREKSALMQRRLAAIVESSADAIISKTLEGIVTTWNPAAERVFGYTASEMIGQSINLLIPPERTREETEVLRRVGAGEKVFHFETVRVRKDGRRIHVSTTVSPLRDGDGRVMGVSKIARDVTERNRTARELQEAQALFHSLVEQLPAGIFRRDWEGRYVFVNALFCRMSGKPADEVLGRVPDNLPEIGWLVDIAADFHEQILMTDEQTTTRRTRRRPDGTVLVYDVVESRVSSPEGEIVGSLGVVLDITETVHAEAALRQSEERMQIVTENMAEGLLLADSEGGILQWNRAALQMYGFAAGTEPRSLGELREHFNFQNLAGEDLGVSEMPLSQLFRGVSLREFHARLRRPENDWVRIFSYNGGRIREPSGREIAFLTIADITERVQAEEALRQITADLEQRVVHRTAELQAANKELEAFSYSISHDLRAPLRAIDGFSQALVEDFGELLPDMGQRYLRTIRQGAQRMAALIDDLLAFSRLNRAPLSRREIDMARQVEECLQELAFQREGREVELKIGLLPKGHGDIALVKQVWINLLSNALKYSQKRERAVIEIGFTSASGERVYFVRDNGAGFDMNYAQKLFGVFQRLHRSEEFEGTGVGLAIVQRIILRHGGRIWAEAAVDQGACFYFSLEPQSGHE